VEPHVISRIRTADGEVIFERTGLGIDRMVSLQNVALMNDMLRATLERGTGRRAAIPGWPAAGKTGTTQAFRDAWFVGYTAELTTGVWVGNDSGAPTQRASGSNMPAAIWSTFMAEAHRGVPVADLPGTALVPALVADGGRRSGPTGWTAAEQPVRWAGEPRRAAPPSRPSLLERLFGR
jgi:penicillin-binding protein 1A